MDPIIYKNSIWEQIIIKIRSILDNKSKKEIDILKSDILKKDESSLCVSLSDAFISFGQSSNEASKQIAHFNKVIGKEIRR